jgi:hypothetical protein
MRAGNEQRKKKKAKETRKLKSQRELCWVQKGRDG